MKKLLILFLILFGCSKAQYDPNISGYHIYWYDLDAGQQPPIAGNYHIFKGDTTITLSWERGTEATGAYHTPYSGVYAQINAIVNSLELWSADTANVSRDVVLSDGIYELTVTEADINENESGHSQPIYIEIKTVYARVQINVRIE
jgi:hypothetical protein